MSFWNTARIELELNSNNPPILNSIKSCVGIACYEMRLGREVYISSSGRTKKTLRDGEQLSIPPGQFAILLVEEKLRMPKDVIGFISIKATSKLRGLVNVSGFHVDPGFNGRIKFSVYNAGANDIILSAGQALFPIWFASLEMAEPLGYTGDHQGQDGITNNDVMVLNNDVASPAELNRRMKVIEDAVKDWKIKLIAVVVVALSPLIGFYGTVIFKYMMR